MEPVDRLAVHKTGCDIDILLSAGFACSDAIYHDMLLVFAELDPSQLRACILEFARRAPQPERPLSR